MNDIVIQLGVSWRMKIVGLLSDENELDEIEYIAKVFVLEQRMREVSHGKHVITPLQRHTIRDVLKVVPVSNTQVLRVRGLN